jgi:hypothetical protein
MDIWRLKHGHMAWGIHELPKHTVWAWMEKKIENLLSTVNTNFTSGYKLE